MTLVQRGDTIYALGPCLGKGGFGVCYKAVERHQASSPSAEERIVAVKKINQQMINKASKEPYLRYEIAIHSQLQHRNVAELFQTFSTSDSIYFVLEYCNKKSLADIIVRVATLPVDLAAYYFGQMLAGLRYIHESHILHRDLKLSNILVNSDDVVKISDFGLSCSVTRGYLERNQACGTPNYLSPEVLLKQGHTVKSDIWSCGVVLYAMFGGIPPFQSDDMLEIYRNILTGSYHFTQYHCDDQQKDLVAKLLHLDPEERPNLDEALEHPFLRYGERYERHLAQEGRTTTKCANIGKSSGVRSLSKSLSSLFVKSRLEKDCDVKHKRSTNGHQIVEQSRLTGSQAKIPRSITVVEVKLLRTTKLLENFRDRPAWNKLSTEFRSGWLTWWRDKTSTVGFYYQLSTGFNCANYNDATCCVHNTRIGSAFFINLKSPKRMHKEKSISLESVNKFYEPMIRDVLEEFQDVPSLNKVSEQLSWVCQNSRSEDAIDYLVSWSSHCGGIYRVFNMSDESIQVNFADTYLFRICGRLCYFYQPAKKSFLVETKSLEAWCCQDINAELVDVLCDLFLPQK